VHVPPAELVRVERDVVLAALVRALDERDAPALVLPGETRLHHAAALGRRGLLRLAVDEAVEEGGERELLEVGRRRERVALEEGRGVG